MGGKRELTLIAKRWKPAKKKIPGAVQQSTGEQSETSC